MALSGTHAHVLHGRTGLSRSKLILDCADNVKFLTNCRRLPSSHMLNNKQSSWTLVDIKDEVMRRRVSQLSQCSVRRFCIALSRLSAEAASPALFPRFLLRSRKTRNGVRRYGFLSDSFIISSSIPLYIIHLFAIETFCAAPYCGMSPSSRALICSACTRQ